MKWTLAGLRLAIVVAVAVSEIALLDLMSKDGHLPEKMMVAFLTVSGIAIYIYLSQWEVTS